VGATARGDSPQVSVILATYDWSSVLRHAVATVLAQTLDDFELLVVGDACSDDSAEVVASFGDPRVHWHDLERNFGSQVGPNNRGLELARGRYVAYLGQDDLWFPDHLRLLVERAESSGADLVFTLASLILPDGGRWLSGLLHDPLFGPIDFVVPSSLLHARRVDERIGPWADHRSVELPPDVEWQQRARAAGLRFAGVERLTVLKFPSGLRPDCYRLRSDAEQAAWRARMAAEPDLEARELVTLLRAASDGRLARIGSPLDVYLPPGYVVRRARVIRGLDAGFHGTATAPLAATCDAASFPLSVEEAPASMAAGARRHLRVTLANRGDGLLASEPPFPVHLSYRWLDRDGGLVVAEGRRSVLDPPVPPGAVSSQQMEVIAPAVTGLYRLVPMLVQEKCRWFDQPAGVLPVVAVEVTAGAAPSTAAVTALSPS
jgi:hypothetical protein